MDGDVENKYIYYNCIYNMCVSVCVCEYHTVHWYFVGRMMAIYNIERYRDDFLANSWLVPDIFHTLLTPCHPYIAINVMEMIFPLVPLVY